jgi:hypothetical protein
VLLAVLAMPAASVSLNARKMAMGGVNVPDPHRLQSENPAYSVVAERDLRGESFCLPIPLGLLALASDPPEFDPDKDGFDPLELGNLVANPPWHLELKEPDPLDGDVTLDLGAEHLRLYWEDAHVLVPEDPLDLGLRWDRFGLGLSFRERELSRWRFQVTPYVDMLADAELDDALYGVLAGGDSLLPNSRYGMSADAKAAAGLSWKLIHARRLAPGGPNEFYVAVAPKLLTGFAMAKSELDFSAVTGEDMFASDSLDIEQDTYLRRTDGFSPGYGFALDLGLAMRRGPVDLGLGVRDIGAFISFPKTLLEHQYLQDTTDGNSESVTDTLEMDASYRYKIKALWTLNAGYSQPTWLVAGELRVRAWQTTMHLGGEYRWRAVALRAGLQRDTREKWQMSGGLGLRKGRAELSFALETHNRFLQDERGVALGMSVNFYEAR